MIVQNIVLNVLSTFVQSMAQLPSWVNFPMVQRAEWLNSLLVELWPHVDALTWKLMQEKVQPMAKEILAEYHLTGFRFQRVELGQQPPRVEGVTVDGVATNKVLMDLDIVYHGDARVQISVSCQLSAVSCQLSAGVSDLKLKGKLRVVMNLIDNLPFIGSVELMFLRPPELDFDLEGAANFLDLPGLSGMLRQVIFETLNAQMVYPNRISIILSDAVPPEKMLLPIPSGVLKLEVIEAKHLPQSDFGGFLQIDPYCIISFGSTTKKTKKGSGSHPTWNETFEFPIAVSEGQTVEIDIYDSDSLSEDEFLGHASIDVESAQKSKIQDLWIELENNGTFHIKTTWFELSDKMGTNTLLYGSKVLSLFIGNVSVSSNNRVKSTKVNVEIDKELLTSKTVGHSDENNLFLFNEGFLTMIDGKTQEFVVKLIDTEEEAKFGELTFNIKDLLQQQKYEQPYRTFKIVNQKVEVSIYLTFNLKLLVLPEEKTIKNATNSLQKMKESSFKPKIIERSNTRRTLPVLSRSLVASRSTMACSNNASNGQSLEALISSLHNQQLSRSGRSIVPPKPPRLDASKSGSLDGQGKKKLLSLNENLDSFRHIDSVDDSINMDDTEDAADTEALEEMTGDSSPTRMKERVTGGLRKISKKLSK